jgi:hypothetical protein
LLTPEERQDIKKRLYFIAESFRSQLPPVISNLYCVDALPALRARLKGDTNAAQTTGLSGLESALQNIIFIIEKIQNIVYLALSILPSKFYKKDEKKLRRSQQQ